MKEKEIQHLYWRAGFGLGYNQLQHLKGRSKTNILGDLFSEAQNYTPIQLDLSEFGVVNRKDAVNVMSNMGATSLQQLRKKSQEKVKELNFAWVAKLGDSKAVFREKMTLFWANVFVCRDNNIVHLQQYNNTLRHHALGDFRTFVKAISRQASMSKYLNNKQNVKQSPNENFARELMELFTLGVGNYTENDIKEAARAFTGWSFLPNGDFYLRKNKHDFETKTFFGKTGNFDGDEIIDIILDQKQCATFICTKIYTYFVNPKIDKQRLDEITNLFYHDYNIETLMHYIFSSNWFYKETNIGVKIKSPMELIAGVYKIVPFSFNNKKQLLYLQKMMGQVLLYPNNVSGWKGDTYWIDSNTLMFRMKLASLLLNNAVINLEEKGEFEDSFERYYKSEQNRNRYLKITQQWDVFNKEYASATPEDLQQVLILSKMDTDTENFIKNLSIGSNKDYCIQLMSLPEYQLC